MPAAGEAESAGAAAAGAAPVDGRQTQQNTLLLNLLILYFRLVVLLLAVWLLGYFGFSASWVMIGLFVYIFNERYKRKRQLQIEIAHELARDEKKSILARVEDLPSWVYFPDIERAEWVNKMISKMWPYIGEMTTEILIKTVEPKIVESMPGYLKSFKFSKIDLGDIPPRIGGVKCFIDNVKRDEIILDVDLIYMSDADIKVSIRGLQAGIKDIQIRGKLRVEFKPLIPVSPLIGGLRVFFLTNPYVNFNLTNLADALDVPGLSDILRGVICEQIANFLVLPNSIPVSLCDNIDLSRLQHPQPQGVLRINVDKAKDLIKADIALVGKGKSDPYVVLHVGAQTFKTKTVNNSLDPVWEEYFEAIVDQRSGQMLELEVFDEDPGNKDDFLGRGTVDIEAVADKGKMSTWLYLEEVKSGSVRLQLTWLHLSPDVSQLDDTLFNIRQTGVETQHHQLSAAILMVKLDNAKSLPRLSFRACIPNRMYNSRIKKRLLAEKPTKPRRSVINLSTAAKTTQRHSQISRKTGEPSPYAVLSVTGNKEAESAVKLNTPDPTWDEHFKFLVNDPNIQNLDVEIKDKKSGESLGKMYVPLKLLLTEPNMTQEQPFVLRDSGANSTVTMRLCMRILTAEKPYEENSEETNEDLIKTSSPTSTPSSSPTTKDAPPPQTDEINGNIEEEVVKSTEAGKTENEPTELRQRSINRKSSFNSTSEQTAGSNGLGRIQLTLRYSQQRNRLVVVIHKCINLVPCDDDRLADPYVRIYLLPEKNTIGKKKTQTKKNTLNPVFDETFEFPVNETDLKSCQLDIAVKNSVSVFSMARHEMGQILINLGTTDLTKALTEWFDLEPEQDHNSTSLESSV
ncbi:extended synaptotagmin-2-B-like isoform X2 [Tubulanus polymorphus]|uniref:extended synaptotagmin-2-B-like isoform X2 n=1 Tax=Tubulanus polymorphus TaxID=672921 RepID=UPI003DA317B0